MSKLERTIFKLTLGVTYRQDNIKPYSGSNLDKTIIKLTPGVT